MTDPRSGQVERLRYRFPPLERRGVVAGWRGGQIAAVAISLVLAVLVVRSRPSVGGIVLALVAAGVGLAVGFWPIGGRTGEQWLPLVVRWLGSRRGGDRRQAAPGPGRGHRVTVGKRVDGAPAVELRDASAGLWSGRRDRPFGPDRRGPGRRGPAGAFEGLTLAGLPLVRDGSGPALGAVFDARSRTATAVLSVRGHSFALLGPVDQDSRVTAWARVLATLAREGSVVHRLQWVESCLPDDGTAVRRYWESRAVLGADAAAGRSYRSLITEAAPATRQHQMLVALSLRIPRSTRAATAGGGGPTGVGARLVREVVALHGSLEGADIEVEGIVGPRSLARLIGDAWRPSGGTDGGLDPTSGAPGPGPGPVEDGTHPHWPWPIAVEPRWDSVHTDGTWHATYWIAEWPRVDVTPDFLGPLFFAPVRRSIAVVMEPVSPTRAARQVAQSRTADLADGELRRRGGFLVTARQTREKQSVEERDVELADGHAQYRFSGYVTVTADTRQGLAQARRVVEQAAGQARIDLRLLYGEQDVAFTCCLPLARGLR